jgi:hypothetical protein
LAQTAHGNDPSMVHRGLFILNNFLCSGVPDPDQAILEAIAELEKDLPPNATQRELAMNRLENTTCGSCHGQFDPLALVLEPYDSIGRFRKEDRFGQALRTDYKLDLDGETLPYENLDEYTKILSESARVRECVAQKTIQFALGRTVSERNDSCFIEEVTKALEDGGSFNAAIATIAKSARYRFSEAPSEF